MNNYVLKGCRSTNEISIEAVIHPTNQTQSGPTRIISFSSSALHRNFTIGLEKKYLILRLRTSKTDLNGIEKKIYLFKSGKSYPIHLAVTYKEDKLRVYINGSSRGDGWRIQGDFSNWDDKQHMILGNEYKVARDYQGLLHSVAIYNRVLSTVEIVANAKNRLKAE
jgi:hypothetical protein